MTRTSRSAAFTLIELLVVISIVVLLIAILLPSLGKARTLARTTDCLTRLKQIAVFNNIYTNESRDYLPYFGRPAGNEEYYWVGKFIRIGLWQALPTYSNDNYIEARAAGDIRICPELAMAVGNTLMYGSGSVPSVGAVGNGNSVCFTTYTADIGTMGAWYAGDWYTQESTPGTPVGPRRINDFRNASAVMGYSEVAWYNNATNAIGIGHAGYGRPVKPALNGYRWRIGGNQLTNAIYPTGAGAIDFIESFRHNREQVNFTFLDGHGETRKFDENNYGGFGKILELD